MESDIRDMKNNVDQTNNQMKLSYGCDNLPPLIPRRHGYRGKSLYHAQTIKIFRIKKLLLPDNVRICQKFTGLPSNE